MTTSACLLIYRQGAWAIIENLILSVIILNEYFVKLRINRSFVSSFKIEKFNWKCWIRKWKQKTEND